MTDLSTTPVLIIDCQTTGSSPKSARLLELGWSRLVPPGGETGETPSIHSTLVALPPDESVPLRISRLTGIQDDDLEGAPDGAGAWRQVLTGAERCPFVAHYARFEIPFLEDLHGGSLPTPVYCTWEIARRLLPDLPSRSIRGIAGYLGHSMDELKRAAHHVEATVYIWQKLLPLLQDQGVTSFADLDHWLAATRPAPSGKKQYAMPPGLRLRLPDAPGVYRLLDRNGRILYVGKATSLKSRVNSYFRGQKTRGSRLNELVSQVADIDIIPADTPLQAALIENDEIKQHDPAYNRALRRQERRVTWCDRHFRLQDPPDRASLGPFTSPALPAALHEILLLLDGELRPEDFQEEIPAV